MERLKKERTEARKRFTKAKNDLRVAMAHPGDDHEVEIKVAFKFLSEVADKLFDVDRRIYDEWLSADETEQTEFDHIVTDSYKKDWFELELKYSKLFEEDNKSSHRGFSASTSSRNTHCSGSGKKTAVRLPKLELTKFDGDAKNWLSFWSSFKKIHNDDTIDENDKMAYLVQTMVKDSPADKLVKSFPPCGENYKQAIEQLKSRYARDELLVEIYVRELLSLVLQQAKDSQSIKLASLYDKLKTQLRALEVLGVTSEKYAAMLYPLVESALPIETLRIWERQRSKEQDIKNDPLKGLLNFMKIEVESDERIQLTRQSLNADESERSKVPTAACLVAGDAKPSTSNFKTSSNALRLCIWCDKVTHSSHECYKAQKMSLDERIGVVAKKKGCTLCLKTKHTIKRCKASAKCMMCQGRHAILMCPELAKPKKEKEAENVLTSKTNSTTLLQTLLVKINGETVRAFIDSGAQRSYIRKDIAEKLDLKPYGEETLKHCLFGGLETREESHKLFQINVKNMTEDTSLNMTVLSKEKICGHVPRVQNDIAIKQKIKSYKLTFTDVGKDTPEVGLLIGADYAGQIAMGTVIRITEDLHAFQTKLGWTLQGKVARKGSWVVASADIVESDINKLWNLEVLGIEDPKAAILKRRSYGEAMDNFRENVTVNDEERYEVNLPWKIDKPELLENRKLAEQRLKSTTKRLKAMNELKGYGKVFEEWLELGIIERDRDIASAGHYLCHHAVIKESSLTTRVRPVFDASAKDANGNSINACLETGIFFLELIPSLVTKFRMHMVGVTSDIKKAFLQISIAKDDRKYLRFLWWDDKEEIVVYRHCRVVFGLTCSPFLLAATLIYHLEKYSLTNYSRSAELLKNSFYVDNCVISLQGQQETEKFISDAKEMMKDGKFELRGWVTAPMRCKETDEEPTLTVLGLKWDTVQDELLCNVNSLKGCKDKVTKRELLSVCNRVFDPIGFTSPSTIVPRMMLQRVWCLKIGWDTELPKELSQEFKAWLDEVHLLSQCSIPRRLTSKPITNNKNSLHVFSDASKHAYATCIFHRSESENKHVSVQLVMAKSRVTPVKELSIPRLELIAALMSTRIYTQVKDALNLDDCKAYFWSDSSVTVTWIVSERDWSTFVKNRVQEITETTRRKDWRHISGRLNPADLPSRGCSAQKLIESKWWEGPDWLKENEDKWPVSIEFKDREEEVNKELRKTRIVTNNTETATENFSTQLDSMSKYTKIVRTLAWIFRFYHNCRNNERRIGDVNFEEVERAEKALYKILQEESFTDTDKLRGMKNLEIYNDKDGLMRVKTRLTLSEENENFKLPILLYGKHPVVEKLVAHKHKLHLHANMNVMASILREDFWILRGKKLVRDVTTKCITCKRFKAESYKTATAPLPRNRVKDAAVFQVTGVDAAGPLILNTGEKCWIILFTCAVYRAVHLELVMAVSTECFLMALRRFIARRGRVQTIYSDNGTNFVGAENLLSSVDWEAIKCYSTIHKIKWIFNPPAAPWWGGWWERLIKMVKQLLRRNLGNSILSFIELETVLCDIESVINSRPLTYITEDDKLQPLTPANFLQSLPGATEVADIDEVDAQSLNARQKFIRKLRSDLRQRFRNEYLSLLVSRRQGSNKAIKLGDVVLVETETKRSTWPLGLIVELYPGADSEIRVAKVKTANGFRVRPVQRLYPLEVHDESQPQPDKGGNEEPIITESVNKHSEESAAEKTRSGRQVKVPQRLDL